MHCKATRLCYTDALRRFLHHYRISIDELLAMPVRTAEEHIIDYIIAQKGYQSKRQTINSLKKFYEMNDILLNWKKICAYLGDYNRVTKDRAYTRDEIKRMADVADVRMKAVILLLASSGMRIGALPELRMKHLSKIIPDSRIYKITVYENSKEEYTTFCTEECGFALDEYLKFRERCGEKLDQNSPIIRKVFDMNDLEQIRKKSEPVALNTIGKVLDLCLVKSGLKTVDHTARSRKEVARAHGFRKFFTTQLVNSKVNPEIREMLLGHRIGLTSAYYRPTEDEILGEYLKAIDYLTINEENRLRAKVNELTEKQDEITLMRLKHEQDMKEMDKKLDNLLSMIQENPKLLNVKTASLKKKI